MKLLVLAYLQVQSSVLVYTTISLKLVFYMHMFSHTFFFQFALGFFLGCLAKSNIKLHTRFCIQMLLKIKMNISNIHEQ